MKSIKKEITFVCTDKVERQCCEPVAAEAERRGYVVRFTANQFERCEIGFYLSHVNFPKYSKFSIITLHDLTQQRGQWPVMWKNEFWSQFDVGFLPGKDWADMWHDASCYDFVRPRHGCYQCGWLKADITGSRAFREENERIIKEYGIDTSKKTVLYAPSWEWGGRQVETAEAVRGTDVNLIIKQFPLSPDKFPEQVELIKEADEKTKTLGLSNVHILDTNINILNAISLCDVLVSEESSTMSEAMLLDRPVIAVTDWLVPDVRPPRKPETGHDFTIKTERKDLRRTIAEVVSDETWRSKARSYREAHFPGGGQSAKTVMDVIDNILYGTENTVPRIAEKSQERTPPQFGKSVRARKRTMRFILLKKKLVDRSRLLMLVWNILRTARNGLRAKMGGYGYIVILHPSVCRPQSREAA